MDVGLDALGIEARAGVYWNLNTPELYEEIARRGESSLSTDDALLVDTGEYIEKAAKYQATVRRAATSLAAYLRTPSHKASWAAPLKGPALIRCSKPTTLPMRK
jgi:ATP-dependent phosphoenolpyruvate carboxykinase